MKRFLGVLTLAGALVFAGMTIARADDDVKKADKAEEKAGKAVEKAATAAEKAAEKPKTVTMTGEVIDTGCYLGHEAKGEKHKTCAATCVAAGMPIGLLTDRDAVYLLVPPHDNKDGYNKAKELVGEKAEISGAPFVRGGMRAIEVASAKPATPAK
jgi:hypothetical protein